MSLVAHYTLNGNAEDLVKGFTGTPTDVSYITGKVGQAASFNGTTSQILISNDARIKPVREVSVSTWFRPVAATGSRQTVIMVGRDSSSGYQIWTDTDHSSYVVRINGALGSTSYTLPGAINQSDWNHVAFSYSAANGLRVYLNGVLTLSGATRGALVYPEIYGAGNSIGSHGGIYHYDGDIDDVRIYDHALSDKEMRDLSKSLVTYLTFNDNSVSEATGNSTGLVLNNVLYNNSPKVGEYCFEGDGTVRTITITDSPVVIDNQTIAMWLYPTSFSARRNPWNKNYGGEGTITQETDGQLNYYYGTNGGNSTPYQGFTTTGALTINQWNHIAIVRDLDALTLTWYINGVQDRSVAATYAQAAVSTSNLTIGDGYTSPYHGRIDDVRQYTTALSADDVAYLYRTGLSVDDTGRMHSKYILESGIVTPNLLDYTTWTIGTSGSQSGFGNNGSASENFIIEDTDAFGKQVAVWEARPDATSDADGGWNGALQPADSSKFYRFSAWIRRTVQGNGSTYLGMNESGGTVLQRDTGGTNTNPYFWSGGWPYPEGEWVLLVGHLWPAGSGTGAEHPDSGRYRLNGTKDPITRDFVFDPNITSILHRAYLYYSTDTATRQQFLYPRIDLLDGTEPSINALLSGFDSENYDRIRNELGASDVPDKPSIKYGRTNIGQISEVGVTNELVTYLPFESDANDRTDFDNDANLVGAIINDRGLFTDGTDDYARIGQPSLDFTSHHWTVSFWIYPYALSGWVISPNSAGIDHRISFGASTIDFTYVEAADTNLRGISAPIAANEWSHIAVQIDPDLNTYIYKNGVLANSAAETAPIAYWTSVWDIGRRINGTFYSNFNMKELKIFDRVLTAEEIAQEYNADLKASMTNGIAYTREIIET